MASFAYSAIGIGQFVGAAYYGHVTDRYKIIIGMVAATDLWLFV